MANIYVERKADGTWKATQNKEVIATGKTQNEAGARAERKSPNDPILAERVRDTNVDVRDHWRRLHPK